MFNLVYASTAKIPISDSELLSWHQPFCEKNGRLGITGLLLYKHGAFMQVLEGEEENVRALYATICQDPRHHCIVTLVAMPVARRQFPDWAMGFENLNGTDVTTPPLPRRPASRPLSTDELSWQGSVAMTLLTTFTLEN